MTTYWLKSAYFSDAPLSFSTPMFPLKFRDKVNHEEIIGPWGYSMAKVA